MGKTSLLQCPLLGTIGDIRRGFNSHNGIDREKISGQQLLGLDAIALPAMLRRKDNANIVGNARSAWTITHLPVADITHDLLTLARHYKQCPILLTQQAVLLEILLQTMVLMQTKEVKLGQKREIVGAGCQNGEIILANGPQVDFFPMQHNQVRPSHEKSVLALLLSLWRREYCVPLDPAPNLVHHLFSHMTSHSVGCGSGLFPAFYRHKEVAEARIHGKLHVAAPNQGVLPDLEILSRDLVVAPA